MLLLSGLAACATTYTDGQGRIHISGIAGVSYSPTVDRQSLSADFIEVKIYGLLIDRAFEPFSISFGYSRITTATVRNRWPASSTVGFADYSEMNVCPVSTGGLALISCIIPRAPQAVRPGEVLDTSQIGFSAGRNRSGLRVTAGYSRSQVIQVADGILICGNPIQDLWAGEDHPAQSMSGLLQTICS